MFSYVQVSYLGINIKIQNRQVWSGRLGELVCSPLLFELEFFGAVFTYCWVFETPKYMEKGLLDKDYLNDASQLGGSRVSYQWIIASCGRALQVRLKVLIFSQKQL